jgi:hypothetical protein
LKLAKIGTTLEKDVNPAVILNRLLDRYHYFVVSLEPQETKCMNIDELFASLIERGLAETTRSQRWRWVRKGRETRVWVLLLSSDQASKTGSSCLTKESENKVGNQDADATGVGKQLPS